MRSNGCFFFFFCKTSSSNLVYRCLLSWNREREEKDNKRRERRYKGRRKKRNDKITNLHERARCIIRAESLAKFELCRTKGIVGEKEREREPIPLILIGFECIWVYRCGLWCTHVVMYRPRVPKLSNESRFRRTSTRRFPR